MTKLCVIKTGQTTFEAESRIEPVTGSPLTAEGLQQIQNVAGQLASQGIGAIYAAGGQSEIETASVVAEALAVKVRREPDLHELDFGMWQGLTTGEIKRRQPRKYRLWQDSPSKVRPPGGETVDEAQERIRLALHGILKRHKATSPLLVLRPVAMVLLRSVVEEAAVEGMWRQMDPKFTWTSYEMADSQV